MFCVRRVTILTSSSKSSATVSGIDLEKEKQKGVYHKALRNSTAHWNDPREVFSLVAYVIITALFDGEARFSNFSTTVWGCFLQFMFMSWNQ